MYRQYHLCRTKLVYRGLLSSVCSKIPGGTELYASSSMFVRCLSAAAAAMNGNPTTKKTFFFVSFFFSSTSSHHSFSYRNTAGVCGFIVYVCHVMSVPGRCMNRSKVSSKLLRIDQLLLILLIASQNQRGYPPPPLRPRVPVGRGLVQGASYNMCLAQRINEKKTTNNGVMRHASTHK